VRTVSLKSLRICVGAGQCRTFYNEKNAIGCEFQITALAEIGKKFKVLIFATFFPFEHCKDNT